MWLMGWFVLDGHSYVTNNQEFFQYILQMEHFSAVKFAMGYQKKDKLSCDNKVSKSL